MLACLGWAGTPEFVSLLLEQVITLIEEMKVQVEKEATEDLTAYDKYMCWCETNEKERQPDCRAREPR